MGTTNDYLKECISDAIIIYLKEKPIEKISVDEIIKKAGVGRATYFRAFNSKTEAIAFKIMKMWKQYCELNDIKKCSFDADNIRHFFTFNYSIKYILEIIYQAGLQDAISQTLCRLMPVTDCMDKEVSANKIFRESFYAYGIYGLFNKWMENGFHETPDEMTHILMEIISTPYTGTMDS